MEKCDQCDNEAMNFETDTKKQWCDIHFWEMMNDREIDKTLEMDTSILHKEKR